MNCPNCEKPIALNARFCGACGQRIKQRINDGPAATPPVAPARPAIAAEPAAAIAGGGSTSGPDTGSATSSALPGLIERIKNIVLSPKLEWPVIAPEPTTIAQLYTGYVMPLSALAAVLAFVHMSLIGVSVPFADAIRTPMAAGLVYAVVAFGFGPAGKMPLQSSPLPGVGEAAVWQDSLHEVIAQKNALLCDIQVRGGGSDLAISSSALPAALGVLCNRIFAAY
jgi:hypothetical protein